MSSNLYGRGDERAQSSDERAKQQSGNRMEDVNASTRPGDVNLADLQKGRR